MLKYCQLVMLRRLVRREVRRTAIFKLEVVHGDHTAKKLVSKSSRSASQSAYLM